MSVLRCVAAVSLAAVLSVPLVAQTADSTPHDPPGKGVWLNYDFIPGERTIWVEDFSGDDVGDFPRRMHLVNGNFEVVSLRGRKHLRVANGGWVFFVLPEKLPPRFTVEVEYHVGHSTGSLKFVTTDAETSSSFGCSGTAAWVQGQPGGPSYSSSEAYDALPEGWRWCRFTVDTRYIRAYIDEHRTGNAPGATVVHTDTLFIDLPGGGDDDPGLLSYIRVAAGGKKLYDRLADSGRVATQGILFDTGSDRIRGESTPTLKEIAEMLQAHPELKLTIEGHTDNIGAAATNQTLSERRAAAVVATLTGTLGVDAARLTAKGFGASKPVAPNTTPEGRQNNRRVELVRVP